MSALTVSLQFELSESSMPPGLEPSWRKPIFLAWITISQLRDSSIRTMGELLGLSVCDSTVGTMVLSE